MRGRKAIFTKRPKRSAWFFCFWLFCVSAMVTTWWWRRKKCPMVNIIKMPTVFVRTIKAIKEPKRSEKVSLSSSLRVWISCLSLIFVCVQFTNSQRIFGTKLLRIYKFKPHIVCVVCVRWVREHCWYFYFVHCANSRYRCVDFFNNNNKLDTRIDP